MRWAWPRRSCHHSVSGHREQVRHEVGGPVEHPLRALRGHPVGRARRVGGGLVGSRPTGRWRGRRRRAGRRTGGDEAVPPLARVQPIDAPVATVVHIGMVGRVEVQRAVAGRDPVGDRVDRADPPGQRSGEGPGRPNIRPGSGSRQVSTRAPAPRSEATVCSRDRPTAPASKVLRRVSLTPTTTAATVGRRARARSQLMRRDVPGLRAQLGEVVELDPSKPSNASASSTAQPRQAPLGHRVAHADRDRVAQGDEPGRSSCVTGRAPRGNRRPSRPSRTSRPGPGRRPDGPVSARPRTSRMPAANSAPSPVTATPASPTTSGSALPASTTTGVPQASASSAARPNVSIGPGAITTSAVASSAASDSRSATKSTKRTGRPMGQPTQVARAAARRRRRPAPRRRRGPAGPAAPRPTVRVASPATAVRSGRSGPGPARPRGRAARGRGGRGGTRRGPPRAAPRPGWSRRAAGTRRPAQLVVHTTTSYCCAERRLSRSVSHRPNRPVPATPSSPARLSCDTIIDAMPRSWAHRAVQRSVNRSETSIRSGCEPFQQAGEPAPAEHHPVAAGAGHPRPPDRDHQPVRGVLLAGPSPRYDQHRLVPGRPVPLAQRAAAPSAARRTAASRSSPVERSAWWPPPP